MRNNWVGSVTGLVSAPDKPGALSESKRKNALHGVLGEAMAGGLPREQPAAPPESEVPPAAPVEELPPESDDDVIPTEGDVASLADAWQSGSRMAVAQRVLSGLNSYTDLVSLVYAIGQEGAMELGSLMDELSSEEEAQTPDEEGGHPLDKYMDSGEGEAGEPSPAATEPGRNLYNER